MTLAPGAVPVLGHAVQFFRDPLAFLRSAQQSGDVVSVRLGPTRAFLVCAPDLVQQVLKNPKVFDKGGSVYDAFRLTFGDGVGACPHQSHRRKRHLVQPALHPTRIAGYAAMMSAEAAALTGGWRSGQALDVDVAMHRLTTTVAARMLFAAQATDAVVAELHALLPHLMRGLFRRAMIPVAPLHRVPTPANRQYVGARQRVHGLVDELLARPSTEDAAVSVLRASGLTGTELHDEVMGLLVGGVETTVATLCWAFVLLDQDKDLRDRLHAEVDTVLAGRPAGHDDLARLDHTGRVVTEVLRLYPPVWVLTRQVTRTPNWRATGCRRARPSCSARTRCTATRACTTPRTCSTRIAGCRTEPCPRARGSRSAPGTAGASATCSRPSRRPSRSPRSARGGGFPRSAHDRNPCPGASSARDGYA
jgi:cytochrome P450